MTFSIVGRCARTGMFGVAITTSSICVGSRCPHVRAGVGAVATQNITDPHLATLVLDAMAAGQDASAAIASVVKNRENISYRQLTAVDARGMTAHFTGANILGTHAVSVAADCVAAGNLLSSKLLQKPYQTALGSTLRRILPSDCFKRSKRVSRREEKRGRCIQPHFWWATRCRFLWLICGWIGMKLTQLPPCGVCG